MSIPSDTSFSQLSLHNQNNGQPRPHQCDDCRYCFAFEADVRRLEPYLDSSTVTVSFGKLRSFAQYGCLFHQWLLTLLCGDEGPHPDLPPRGVVEIRVSLKQVYTSELIPHSPQNQDETKRTKFSPATILRYSLDRPLARYAYQSACSPYNAVVHVRLKSSGDVLLTGSGELSMCQAQNYSRLCSQR